MTTIWLLAKAFLAQIGKLLALAIEHWRVILCLLILGYCLYKYNSESNRADQAVQALNEYISAAHAARAQRDRENLLKETQSKIALAAVLADHQVSLAKLNLDRQREAKNLKDLYENKITSIGRSWTDRLRVESQTGNAATGVSGFQEAADKFAQGLRDCDAAYTTLEKACQVTTTDYNTLWTAWDKECEIHGCN
jgi:hypothetical protein